MPSTGWRKPFICCPTSCILCTFIPHNYKWNNLCHMSNCRKALEQMQCQSILRLFLKSEKVEVAFFSSPILNHTTSIWQVIQVHRGLYLFWLFAGWLLLLDLGFESQPVLWWHWIVLETGLPCRIDIVCLISHSWWRKEGLEPHKIHSLFSKCF